MTMLPELLKTVGYRTAMVGKWHLGTRWAHSLPGRRGFDYHFGILGGSGDHLTQETTAVSVPGSMWSPTSFLTTKLKDNHRGLPWDLWEKKEASNGDFWEGPAVGQTGRHSCFLYTSRAVSIINKHDPATPLFLYFSQQVPHMPLTELPEFEDPKNTLKMSRTYNAMVACADQATLNLTLSLKLRGMWANTLMLFASDNGGHTMRAGNNHPFRGGKYSEFEGGVRTLAFVAGGVLPSSAPKTIPGPVAIADWYATFAYLAGIGNITDHKSVGFSSVPPVDSINMWPMLTGETNDHLRTEIPFDDAMIVGDWKFIKHESAINYDFTAEVGDLSDDNGEIAGFWTGADWPIRKGSPRPKGYKDDVVCPQEGCLFNLKDDPYEEKDLSASEPDKFQEMKAAYERTAAKVWQYNGDSDAEKYEPPEDTECLGLTEAVEHHQGFLGPVCLSKDDMEEARKSRQKMVSLNDKKHNKQRPRSEEAQS